MPGVEAAQDDLAVRGGVGFQIASALRVDLLCAPLSRNLPEQRSQHEVDRRMSAGQADQQAMERECRSLVLASGLVVDGGPFGFARECTPVR